MAEVLLGVCQGGRRRWRARGFLHLLNSSVDLVAADLVAAGLWVLLGREEKKKKGARGEYTPEGVY